VPTFSPSPQYRDQGPYPTGVLLVNSGTPDSLTTRGVRRFLRRLLRDTRTIEVPRAIWCWVLYGIILPLRPAHVLPKYRRVWTDAGSPLAVNSDRLREALETVLASRTGEPVAVELGMLYSSPDVATGLARLRERGAQRIVVLPLFPQYSGSSAGATYDQVGKALRRWRFLPELHLVPDYHLDPGYIDAVASRIAAHRAAQPDGEHLLLSFHGIPASYVAEGDPYERKCRATAAAIAARLGIAAKDWSLSFQSRVGRARWLEPYTEATVKALAARGIRQLDVACPGFALDCLETTDEMGVEAAETFHAAGGGKLRYIPALNDSSAHVNALAALLAPYARQCS
jgi:ferrochelatase